MSKFITTSALKPSLVALAIGMAFSSAHAAEAVAEDKLEDVEVIEVTGIRGSMDDALNKKRMSDQIVDSISAEDVGKFPDDNVAEALQRIAGVSIGRDETGAGDVVSIRGMGPDMNKVTMNGQQVASAGGVGNTGQGFSFGVLSADMISALEVWKSPKASQDAGSIGGTVNIRTKAPLELDDTKIQASIEQGYQEVGEEHTQKYTFRYISQFADNKVGVSFGANFSDTPSRTDSAGSNSYPKTKGPNTIVDEAGLPVEDDTYIINAFRVQQRTANREKMGADLTIQWRPTENLDFSLNGLYAEQNDDDYSEQFQLKFNSGGRQSRVAVADENNFITEAVVTPKNGNQRDVQVQTWRRVHDKETKSVNLNMDYILTDALAMNASAGTSEGSRWMGQEFPVFQASGITGYNMNTADSSRFPDLTINGEEMMPADSEFRLVNINNQIKRWEDTNDYAQVDFDYDTDFELVHKISAGVKVIETSSEQNVAKGKLSGNLGTMEDFYGYTTDSSAYYKGTPYNSWSTASFDLIEDVYGPIDQIPLLENTNPDTGVTKAFGSPIENWEVENEITAAYIQADFEGELFVPFRGNVGVRYEETDMTAYSMTQVGAEFSPTTTKNDYSDVLPSLNVMFDLSDELVLRFSAAKVMSRPIARDLAPAYRLSASEEDAVGTGGNPYLDPFRANQIDLGLEWYFDEGALLSAGYFQKDVESFIAREEVDQVLNGIDYKIVQPVNGGSAEITGIELGYQQHFSFLPGFLKNTGTQLNYTYTDSSTDFMNATFMRKMPMEGLSENTVNATVYYEVKDFSVRVAYTYRDEYLYSGASWSTTPIFVMPSTFVDAQVNYRLNDMISFGLKANNLTNQELEQYTWEEQYPMSTAETGRNYALNMTVKL